MERSNLHDRLAAAVGKKTYRALGEMTGTHPETVRRYMQGQAPSVEFVSALCASLGLNGDWVLTGRGVMRTDDVQREAVRASGPSDLLGAIATTLEGLGERVERLESLIQSMDVGGRLGSDRIVSTDVEGKPAEPRFNRRESGDGAAVGRIGGPTGTRARPPAGGAGTPDGA